MLKNNLKSSLNFLKYSRIKTTTLIKCLSTAEPLKPVKLAFATYDTTTNNSNKPPFLILHGLFGSKQNWASLCKAYRQKLNPPRKIIALDLRNHGESEHSDEHSYAHLAADIKHFLYENDIDKMTLMGHSMGGRCAMLFALKYPELVEKLIIADISPVTLSPHLGQLPVLLSTMERVQFPENVLLSQARIIVDKQLSETISSPDLRAFILTNLVPTENKRFKWRINIPVLIRNFDQISRFPLISDLQYAGETLFLGGGDSHFIPKSDYPKIKQLFPNAELKYIEGAGHWLHSEKPHEFLKVTLEFLNKSDTTS